MQIAVIDSALIAYRCMPGVTESHYCYNERRQYGYQEQDLHSLKCVVVVYIYRVVYITPRI